MSEQDTTTPVEAPESPAEPLLDEGQGIIPEEAQKGNKEARYRTERNAARAEVEALQARLDVLHRLDIERLASADLAHPSDVFTLSGNSVADYLTEDGTVDSEKVKADVAAILLERPGLKPRAPAVDRTQGLWSESKSAPTWGSFLKDKD